MHNKLIEYHIFLTCMCVPIIAWQCLFEYQVIAVGPGPLDEEGKRKALSVTSGNSVMYSKYAGNDFKGADGSDYIVLRASDVMAVLS